MAVLGLRFCARAFSSCGEQGPLFIAVRGPLTIAASLVAEHRLQTRRLSNCGSRAQLFRSMWHLPRPGLEPVCPALAGRFSTTAPPGKPLEINFHCKVKELLQWRITGLNVNIMTSYECVSCLVIAIIVAFVVVIHLQCLVSVYLSLVKIKKN